MVGLSEGAKPGNRTGCDLPRFYSSDSTFGNGRRAKVRNVLKGSFLLRLSFGMGKRVGPGERKKLRRVNPKSEFPTQAGNRSRVALTVKDVETPKTAVSVGHGRASLP